MWKLTNKTFRFAVLLAVAWVTTSIYVLYITISGVILTDDWARFPSGAIDNDILLSHASPTTSIMDTALPAGSHTWTQEPKPVVLTFLEIMQQFPWDPFNRAVQEKDSTEARRYASNLTWELYPFLIRTPPTPAKTSCKPPPINFSAVIHKCIKLAYPRKVGVLLTFSFEVDALEIHFHELDAVVDKFFLIESESTHQPRFVESKPLIWETLKSDPRFSPFVHKTVHFTLRQRDVQSAGLDSSDKFAIEKLERRVLWERLQRWNNRTGYFNDEDVLGFGDADEIPDRNNVAFLKNCQLPNNSESVDIGIWFPIDGIDTVFMTDLPVSGHPFTLGDPTYWTLGGAKSFAKISGQVPSRRAGKSGSFLLGGMHLTKYFYPPYAMIKHLTSSEGGWTHLKRVVELGMLYRNGSFLAAVERVNPVEKHWLSLRRILKLWEFKRKFPDEAEKIVKVPWFLKCNLKRYPGVYKGTWDPRLD